jgi:hypothetical protein
VNAQSLFQLATQNGLLLSLAGDGGLKVTGDALTIESMRSDLSKHKPDLLAHLIERQAITMATATTSKAKSPEETKAKLAAFAAEAGFDWNLINGAPWITPDDLQDCAENCDLYGETVLRDYVESVVRRRQVNCQGRAFQDVCHCMGSCKAIESTRSKKLKAWLHRKLDSVQSAKVLELEAAQHGFTMADLDAAKLAIGGVHVNRHLGVNYWRLKCELH